MRQSGHSAPTISAHREAPSSIAFGNPVNAGYAVHKSSIRIGTAFLNWSALSFGGWGVIGLGQSRLVPHPVFGAFVRIMVMINERVGEIVNGNMPIDKKHGRDEAFSSVGRIDN